MCNGVPVNPGKVQYCILNYLVLKGYCCQRLVSPSMVTRIPGPDLLFYAIIAPLPTFGVNLFLRLQAREFFLLSRYFSVSWLVPNSAFNRM